MSRRIHRVNEALREVISETVEKDLKDPRLGFVTITAVRTAPDLRDARVYVSVLGSDADREASLAALQTAHGVLQGRVAERLRMKRTPRLKFIYDDTTDRAMHLSELLAREEEELAARAGDRQGEPEEGRQEESEGSG